jgi:hypothetical protein
MGVLGRDLSALQRVAELSAVRRASVGSKAALALVVFSLPQGRVKLSLL